jgi:hypothetical protein
MEIRSHFVLEGGLPPRLGCNLPQRSGVAGEMIFYPMDALIVAEETTPPPRRETTLPVHHQESILNSSSESKS